MADLLFGFQGRANRAKFWLVALAIFVVEMIVFAADLRRRGNVRRSRTDRGGNGPDRRHRDLRLGGDRDLDLTSPSR